MTIKEASSAFERAALDRLAEALQKSEYKIINALADPDFKVDGVKFSFHIKYRYIYMDEPFMPLHLSTEADNQMFDGYTTVANGQKAEDIKNAIESHKQKIEELESKLATMEPTKDTTPAETAAGETEATLEDK